MSSGSKHLVHALLSHQILLRKYKFIKLQRVLRQQLQSMKSQVQGRSESGAQHYCRGTYPGCGPCWHTEGLQDGCFVSVFRQDSVPW